MTGLEESSKDSTVMLALVCLESVQGQVLVGISGAPREQLRCDMCYCL